MKKIAAILTAIAIYALSVHTANAATAKTTYFKCTVMEKVSRKNVEVTVKFAIKNFDPFDDKGELIFYPGMSKKQLEMGTPILVEPAQVNERYTMMTNLNSQGGDLRIKGGDIMLWGDGDGYQFTDLVLWDDNDEELAPTEGYVRDYGSAYGDNETFKQFIKCEKSNKKL